jgi:CHAT domain-containing protein
MYDIAARKLPNAESAFLSACWTATGVDKVHMYDESIHLAASLQLAGFRSIIATIWAVEDSVAPRLVGAFYKCLFKHQTPTAEDSAEALSEAIKSLRKEGVPSALLLLSAFKLR